MHLRTTEKLKLLREFIPIVTRLAETNPDRLDLVDDLAEAKMFIEKPYLLSSRTLCKKLNEQNKKTYS